MKSEKNPDKLSEIDRKLGITMRECRKCGFRFHIILKQKRNFDKRRNEPQEVNDLCLTCAMGKK